MTRGRASRARADAAIDRIATAIALVVGATGIALVVAACTDRAEVVHPSIAPTIDEPSAVGASASRDVAVASCPRGLAGVPWGRFVFPGCPAYAYHKAFASAGDGLPCTSTIAVGDTTPMRITHTYDQRGRYLSEVVDGNVVHRCAYSGDRLAYCESTRTQGDDAFDSTRTMAIYDQGHITQIDGYRFHYNAAVVIDAITLPDGSVDDLDYDSDGRLVAERSGNDRVDYRYDRDRLTSIGDLQLAYDADGHVVTATVDDLVETFTYDQRGRLASKSSSPDDKRVYGYCQ